MKKSNMKRFGALVVGLSFVAVSCGSSDDAATDTTVATEAAAGGELEGMKGTMPLVELSAEFKDGVNAYWTGAGNEALVDYSYTAEAFDAVMLIALAAEAAKTDGSALADSIITVSRDGEKCTTYADCVALVQAGTDIDYDGASGPNTMNGNGEPIEASYGVLTFDATNRFDYANAAYIPASAPESDYVPAEKTTVTRKGDGQLKIGTLLPETGNLAFLGAPEFAGVEYAISLINAAGGVLGKDVLYSQGDSGDNSTDTASTTVDRLLSENVDAIIGAASSGVSLKVIDKITQAGVVQFSPANTSDALSTYADSALYFRNAPPDTLQGAVLAGLIAADGNASVYILALDDAYGTGLAASIGKNLEAAGVSVLGTKIYDPAAVSFDAEVAEVVAANPDAIMLVTFDEGSRILRTMVEQGIGPKVKKVYGCDGNMGNALGENFDAGK
jgi:ABC-type branched-subunit amino acid transport system substrate-binding protein